MDYRYFSDRIAHILNLYSMKFQHKVADYFGVGLQDVQKWSNSLMKEPPLGMDYSRFLYMNPEFSREWLEKGEGDVFVKGSEEENIKMILKREEEYLFKERLTQG